MKIGFTGSRDGMTTEQYLAVRVLIEYQLLEEDNEFHHGDCIGGDKQFHDMEFPFNIKKIGHPPNKDVARAFCEFDEIRDPRKYLDRNHDIVDETDCLVVAPKEIKMITRSGTWSTIRYAMKQGKPIYIVWRNGLITEREFDWKVQMPAF